MTIETSTGVYITYPRAREFQVAHDRPDTLVNNRYTRVGFTRDSFAASGRAYRIARCLTGLLIDSCNED